MAGNDNTPQEVQTMLKRTRAALRLDILANFMEIIDIQIPMPPKQRTLFPGSDDEYWYEVDSDNHNSTTCICELNAGSRFGTHYHKTNIETIILETPGTEVEVVTEDEIKHYEYPDVIVIPMNMKHAVVNHSAFKITCRVIWSPEAHGILGQFVTNSD
jgi:quercetin dioxygenase-like cupin family protein